MIPKIIHYCWLSTDPLPNNIQRCIDSWKIYLPDYEIILWNFDRFPQGTSTWVDQAFQARKYAFAADYIRLFALFHYGGIYLDSDVEVLRPFDDLLTLPYFIGQESTEAGIEAATLGFEKGHPLIELLFRYYEGRQFIHPDGSMDMVPMPTIFRRCIASQFDINFISKISDFVFNPEIINIFPVEYFSPKHWKSMVVNKTERTYSIHHFAASWRTSPQSIDVHEWIRKNVLNLRNLTTRYLLLRRNVCFLSNSNLETPFENAFGLHNVSPIAKSWMSEEDFVQMLQMKQELDSNSLVFVKMSEAKFKSQSRDFFPVAKIKNTNIEIYYEDCISREEVRQIWAKGLSRWQNTTTAILITDRPQNFARSGKDKMKTLLDVALHLNRGCYTLKR